MAYTEYLFSYGTLQFPSVQQDVFKRLLGGEPDVLIGYRQELLAILDLLWWKPLVKPTTRS